MNTRSVGKSNATNGKKGGVVEAKRYDLTLFSEDARGSSQCKHAHLVDLVSVLPYLNNNFHKTQSRKLDNDAFDSSAQIARCICCNLSQLCRLATESRSRQALQLCSPLEPLVVGCAAQGTHSVVQALLELVKVLALQFQWDEVFHTYHRLCVRCRSGKCMPGMPKCLAWEQLRASKQWEALQLGGCIAVVVVSHTTDIEHLSGRCEAYKRGNSMCQTEFVAQVMRLGVV